MSEFPNLKKPALAMYLWVYASLGAEWWATAIHADGGMDGNSGIAFCETADRAKGAIFSWSLGGTQPLGVVLTREFNGTGDEAKAEFLKRLESVA